MSVTTAGLFLSLIAKEDVVLERGVWKISADAGAPSSTNETLGQKAAVPFLFSNRKSCSFEFASV